MKRLVAVEITDDYIRGAEIEDPLTTKPKLVGFGELALPRGVANETEIYDVDSVSEAFKELWKQEKFKTKSVALGLGGRKILVRDYETPLNDLATIRKNLSFDAANLLPAQMGAATLDFYPTEIFKSQETEMDMVKGLIVASPTETAEKIIAALTSADLYVEYVDYLPFAEARCARKAYGTDGDYLLVNIKNYSSDIIAIRNGTPQMVRVVPYGIIARKDVGGKHRGAVDSAASFNGGDTPVDPLEALVKGIHNTDNYYVNKGGQPSALLLMGEASLLPEVQERLPQILQMGAGVLTLDRVTTIPRSKESDPLQEASILGLVGVGMRGLK